MSSVDLAGRDVTSMSSCMLFAWCLQAPHPLPPDHRLAPICFPGVCFRASSALMHHVPPCRLADSCLGWSPSPAGPDGQLAAGPPGSRVADRCVEGKVRKPSRLCTGGLAGGETAQMMGWLFACLADWLVCWLGW